jgi:hypothetical protein
MEINHILIMASLSASGFELNTFVDFQPELGNSTRKINKKRAEESARQSVEGGRSEQKIFLFEKEFVYDQNGWMGPACV